jgi:hypothetical protein
VRSTSRATSARVLDVSVDDVFADIVEQRFAAGIRIGEMIDREMVSRRACGGCRGFSTRHDRRSEGHGLRPARRFAAIRPPGRG